jgi:hypothetical protein
MVLVGSAVVAGSFFGSQAGAAQTGVWQFNGDLSNSLPGGSMTAVGGWAPSFVADTIGGSPATVLSFPAMSNTQALDMPTGVGPDDGSATTRNNWSIVMDVRFVGAGNYTSLWDVHGIGIGDGDFFVRDTEGIGISGIYHESYDPSAWSRIAVSINASGTGYVLDKYVDGVYVGTTGTGISPDGKEGIVGGILHLFADEDGESSAGYVNSVAFYDNVLSANAIAALGGASAAGIPAVPEPSSLGLVMGALGLLASVRNRRLSV